jgi:hypothetical protein
MRRKRCRTDFICSLPRNWQCDFTSASWGEKMELGRKDALETWLIIPHNGTGLDALYHVTIPCVPCITIHCADSPSENNQMQHDMIRSRKQGKVRCFGLLAKC